MVKDKQVSLALKEDNDNDIDEDQEIAIEIGQLPPKALSIFRAYVENFLSVIPISEVALCKKIGVSRSYLGKLKTKSTWTKAFQHLVVNGVITRTLENSERYIDNLERVADEGNVSANKTLLGISGIYKHSGGININIGNNESRNPFNTSNPAELIDQFLIFCGKSGIQIDQLLNRYIELKNENAF